jgi:hypothetical protein
MSRSVAPPAAVADALAAVVGAAVVAPAVDAVVGPEVAPVVGAAVPPPPPQADSTSTIVVISEVPNRFLITVSPLLLRTGCGSRSSQSVSPRAAPLLFAAWR